MFASIITIIKYDLSAIVKQGSKVILNIIVKPNNKKNSLLELKEDYMKIGINAPPVDGEANQ
jgi:uncharacterized protein YggU (UPF0235/DUF167 family)